MKPSFRFDLFERLHSEWFEPLEDLSVPIGCSTASRRVRIPLAYNRSGARLPRRLPHSSSSPCQPWHPEPQRRSYPWLSSPGVRVARVHDPHPSDDARSTKGQKVWNAIYRQAEREWPKSFRECARSPHQVECRSAPMPTDSQTSAARMLQLQLVPRFPFVTVSTAQIWVYG